MEREASSLGSYMMAFAYEWRDKKWQIICVYYMRWESPEGPANHGKRRFGFENIPVEIISMNLLSFRINGSEVMGASNSTRDELLSLRAEIPRFLWDDVNSTRT